MLKTKRKMKSDISARIIDSLCQVLCKQPTLLLAPILWLVLLTVPLWKPDKARQKEANDNPRAPFTRMQHRCFAKLLKMSLMEPQRDAPRRKAMAPLPFCLRKQRHHSTPKAPTLGMQASLRNLDKLKTRTLLLQRQARYLRTHCLPYVTNAFNKGGIGTSSRLPQTQRKKSRHPKYHPIPADGAPDAFIPAPWTTQQRNAAHKIISPSTWFAPPLSE